MLTLTSSILHAFAYNIIANWHYEPYGGTDSATPTQPHFRLIRIRSTYQNSSATLAKSDKAAATCWPG